MMRLDHQRRRRGVPIGFYMAPLFVAQVLIGISTLMFNRNVLGLPGNLPSAILANTTCGPLLRLSGDPRAIGALRLAPRRGSDGVRRPAAAHLLEVTLPNIWPAVPGAFLVSFILGFNDFEISFYNLGAVPTLPTVAWGTLRHGIEPELHALATLVNPRRLRPPVRSLPPAAHRPAAPRRAGGVTAAAPARRAQT
jgi:ABC-type spermidine/putrescine transport system permease subunit II